MSGPGSRIERLSADHDLAVFDSSDQELDAWLQRHALAAQRTNPARTFLVVDDYRIVGYFSLTMGAVRRADAPRRFVRGLPAYPVGMVLLARLAVDRRKQGRGFGGLLLAETLRRAVTAGEMAGARLVVVDAIDESAARFYEHHGFIAVPDHPLRLYRSMKDVRASLDAKRGS